MPFCASAQRVRSSGESQCRTNGQRDKPIVCRKQSKLLLSSFTFDYVDPAKSSTMGHSCPNVSIPPRHAPGRCHLRLHLLPSTTGHGPCHYRPLLRFRRASLAVRRSQDDSEATRCSPRVRGSSARRSGRSCCAMPSVRPGPWELCADRAGSHSGGSCRDGLRGRVCRLRSEDAEPRSVIGACDVAVKSRVIWRAPWAPCVEIAQAVAPSDSNGALATRSNPSSISALQHLRQRRV